MSRLDDHVGWVRVKLTLAAFVRALPWAVAVLAGVTFLVILVERFSEFKLPRHELWLWIGLGRSGCDAEHACHHPPADAASGGGGH